MSLSTPLRPLLRSASLYPSPSLSRSLSCTPTSLAAAKGKVKKPVPMKQKQGGSFNKVRGGAAGGGGGGGSSRNKGELLTISVPESLQSKSPALASYKEFQPESASQLYAQPLRYSTKEWERLMMFGSPRRLEREFALSHPTTVLRQSSLHLLEILERIRSGTGTNIGTGGEDGKGRRMLLTGSPGCGKSSVLLQAVMTGLMDDWVVIYVPKAIDLISSSSPYAYHSPSSTYHLPTLTSTFLTTLLSANQKILSQIKLKQDVESKSTGAGGVVKFEKGMDLGRVCGEGARDEAIAVEVAELVMRLLGEQSEYGVMIAIDEAQALFMTSKYRSPQHELLESYALSLPRLLLDYVSGRKGLARGAVLAAVSLSNTQYLPPVELFTAHPTALHPSRPLAPASSLNPHHLAHASSLSSFPVEDSLSFAEAQQIGKIYRDKKVLGGFDDEMVERGWSECGGNAREFGRGLGGMMAGGM